MYIRPAQKLRNVALPVNSTLQSYRTGLSYKYFPERTFSVNKFIKGIKVTALAMFAILAIWLLTACGAGTPASIFVGTWLNDEGTLYTIVFNEDGTGTRGEPGDYEEITWGVSGSTLNIRRQGHVPSGYIRNERWSFTVYDNTFRIESRQVSGRVDTYTREGYLGEVAEALVGTWTSNQYFSWRYEFNSDGTGLRGEFDDTIRISWGTIGNIVILQHYEEDIEDDVFRVERWEFSFVDGFLRMECAQGTNDLWFYSRCYGPGEVYQPLVGIWSWDDDARWQYIFNADGTGRGGMPGDTYTFDWGVNNGQLRLFYMGSMFDMLDMQMSGDALQLLSSHSPDLPFTYTRSDYEAEFSLEINPELFGTWTWDEDNDWVYLFANDGTGLRGWSSAPMEFVWSTYEDELWMFFSETDVDVWLFEVSGNSLWLSTFDYEVQFFYTRQ